jgi:hypothetical protein
MKRTLFTLVLSAAAAAALTMPVLADIAVGPTSLVTDGNNPLPIILGVLLLAVAVVVIVLIKTQAKK